MSCSTSSGAAGQSPNSTLTSHVNFARRAIGDTGEEQRLIRTIPRKGFRFVGDVQRGRHRRARRNQRRAEAAPAADRRTMALALPDQPSIAVLPFLNLSGDPEQDYFADGVVEDIIRALSRIDGCSSSRAIRASPTKAARST